MAAVGACAGFGAICGSSLATAATMGQVTLPELKRAGYAGSLSTGALAAGGTLGILIPPSVPLVIYGILTEESSPSSSWRPSCPGIIAMRRLHAGDPTARALEPAHRPGRAAGALAGSLKALAEVTPVLLIFVVVIVGIYGGWANAHRGRGDRRRRLRHPRRAARRHGPRGHRRHRARHRARRRR